MSREPYLSVTVAASADAVWRALRDPDEILRWFGWEYPDIEDEVALIFHGHVPAGAELPEGLDTSVEVDDEARSLRTGAHLIEVQDAAGTAVVRVTRVIDVGDAGWEHFHAEIDHVEAGGRSSRPSPSPPPATRASPAGRPSPWACCPAPTRWRRSACPSSRPCPWASATRPRWRPATPSRRPTSRTPR